MPWDAILMVAVALGAMAVFTLRVSAFRIDRPAGYGGYFGPPLRDSRSFFDPDNYTPAGQRLLRWYLVVLAVQVLGIGLAMYLLARRGML